MWVTRLQPWVAAWDDADEQLAEDTGPHTEPSFRAYDLVRTEDSLPFDVY